jgi:hypothetical protein
MKLRMTVIAFMLTAVPCMALAQGTPSTPGIDKRQETQQKSINEGAKSGQLTDKEAKRLQKGQKRVQKMEDKAVADGKVTKKEGKKIEHTQDQQSKKIARERSDKQTAK